MADKEKIVEIFSELINFADYDVHPVVSPENWDVYAKLHDLIVQAEEEVITLLKEQEPVNPIRIVHDSNFLYDLCGFCGKTLPVSIEYDRARYCPLCGKPVKWHK